nr:peptidase M1 [Thermoflexibacter sp.]
RAYVWYQKGSLIMYALADYIGEENLNRGLRNFLDSAAFRQKAPFATTSEFLPYLEAVTPDSLKYFLEDGWKKIALYENRITKASYQKIKDDEYKVKMTVNSKKLYYDGLGKETGKGEGKDYIEIGIFTEDGKNKKGMTTKTPLYLKKHWLGEGEHTLEFTVKGKPIKAGIDPYNKLIDRIPDDNVMSVSEE